MDKKLSYTADEIDARLGLIPTLQKSIANAEINGRIFATISAASASIVNPKEGAWLLIGSGPYTIYRYNGSSWASTGVSYQQGAATTTSQVTDTTQGKTQQTINSEVQSALSNLSNNMSSANLASRTQALETLLGYTPSSDSSDDDEEETDTDWPKTNISTSVKWFKSFDVGDTYGITGDVGSTISNGSTDAYKHWVTAIPCGAKSATINTYGRGGDVAWSCAIFTDDNDIIISKVSGKTSSTKGTFESFTSDVPSGAKKIYVSAYIFGVTYSSAVSVVFLRDISKGSSYNLDLSAQRNRANYINSSTKVWTDGGTNNYCHQLHSEINTSARYKVTAGTSVARIAFLTGTGSTADSNPSFCEGTTLDSVSAGSNKVFDVPSDAVYLYVYAGKSDGMGSIPTSIEEIWNDSEEEDTPILPDLPEEESTGSVVVDKVNNNEARLNRAETAITTLSSKVTALENNTSSSSTTSQSEVLNACVSMFAKIGIVGTSWDSGLIYSEKNMSWTNAIDRRDLSWPAVLGRRNGVEIYNYAKRGATTWDYVTSGNEQMTALKNGPVCDLYIVGLLGNDASDYGLAKLGTTADIEAQTADTFYGNYAKILTEIITKAPRAKIILLARNSGTSEVRTAYANAISNIATAFNLPQPMNWYDDAWYASWGHSVSSEWGSHPSAVQLSGYALCFERMFSKMVALPANKDYFWSYLGSVFSGYSGSYNSETKKYS